MVKFLSIINMVNLMIINFYIISLQEILFIRFLYLNNSEQG